MINHSQLELLESMIGSDGFLIETIMENEQFNMGVKALYLQRSIRKDCHAFLLDLDKLYKSDLSEEVKSAYLEFIQTLKRINDLCFNNEIKSGDYGLKKALDFTFERLGNVNPQEFKEKIIQLVNQKIQTLKENQADLIKQEQKNHREMEMSVFGSIKWRQELDLPSEQLTPMVRHIDNGIFKARRSQNYLITTSQEQALLNQQINISNEAMSVSTLLGIQANPREDHESLQLLRRIGSWVYFANISLDAIFNLQATLLMSLANRVDDVIVLVQELEISFEFLSTLPEQTRNLLLKHSDSVKNLINNTNYTLQQLLELSYLDLKTVLKHPFSQNSQSILMQYLDNENSFAP